ncbi:MAG TPA: MBL fold metallo-hydrolase, partial [Oscillatoriaceae cyanobacterium]
YLRREGCTRLELMVATHAHRDHIGGLPALLDALPVAQAWDAGQPSRTAVNDALLASWLRHDVPFEQVHPGVRRVIDGVAFDVLSAGRDLRDLNNGSVVVMLTYGRFRALLTGDMQQAAEQKLLESQRDLHADVLKVAHHGSRTGTTDAFLARVRPRFAVISVGADNRFGHPHVSTLRRLRRFRVPYRRTDQDGAVLVRSDGRIWQECDGRTQWAAWAQPKD